MFLKLAQNAQIFFQCASHIIVEVLQLSMPFLREILGSVPCDARAIRRHSFKIVELTLLSLCG